MKVTKESKNPNRKKNTTHTASQATKPAANSEITAGGKTGSSKSVVIEARIDVGFGNALYLRGEGEGLSWNQGILLTCVDSSTWKWSAPVSDKVKFKLLLNDAVWAKGEDLEAAPGQKVEISPAF
jgi:hypothetical protein